MITSPQTNIPGYFGASFLHLANPDLLDEYERQKAVIARLPLTPQEYAKAIRRLAEELGV